MLSIFQVGRWSFCQALHYLQCANRSKLGGLDPHANCKPIFFDVKFRANLPCISVFCDDLCVCVSISPIRYCSLWDFSPSKGDVIELCRLFRWIGFRSPGSNRSLESWQGGVIIWPDANQAGLSGRFDGSFFDGMIFWRRFFGWKKWTGIKKREVIWLLKKIRVAAGCCGNKWRRFVGKVNSIGLHVSPKCHVGPPK